MLTIKSIVLLDVSKPTATLGKAKSNNDGFFIVIDCCGYIPLTTCAKVTTARRALSCS